MHLTCAGGFLTDGQQDGCSLIDRIDAMRDGIEVIPYE
jgi:hypothetical protein